MFHIWIFDYHVSNGCLFMPWSVVTCYIWLFVELSYVAASLQLFFCIHLIWKMKIRKCAATLTLLLFLFWRLDSFMLYLHECNIFTIALTLPPASVFFGHFYELFMWRTQAQLVLIVKSNVIWAQGPNQTRTETAPKNSVQFNYGS